MREATFEIIEYIGIIEEKKDGWKKEVNIVAWNGGRPKIDIRDWNPTHERMSRGITLTSEAAEKLMFELKDYFLNKERDDNG